MEEINTENMSNFIHDIIDDELERGVNNRVQTRFPPEPNGYLHIGHAKAICIDFMTAIKYGGICNLRFDDTNPSAEDMEYVDAIMEDIKWLGFKWENVYFASSYFDFLYECAIKLIKKGKAFVCDLPAQEIREYRGTLTTPGKNSPYRDRSIEENLELFQRMTDGEFPDGARVLRAKVDMSSPNINMRDPVIYRIAHVSHHQTGDKWCVYPMYDFAHPLSDAIERVTYSLCSLEFENNRPIYNWFLDEIGFDEPPRQIEFARLNLNYCITSKRNSSILVEDKSVSGWDDPRMVTLCGMRRRGYPPAAIRTFIDKIGVSKVNSVVDFGFLESCVRDELNASSPRAMVVLEPLKVIIDNYPKDKTEEIEIEIHPEKLELGTKKVTFSREIYVEKTDFMAEPVKKYHRLYPGNEVRLKGAYYVTCTGYDTDENGKITALHCTYDPETKGGSSPDKRKVRGTIHWAGVDAVEVELRLYDRLFDVENPAELSDDEFESAVNPNSLVIISGCLAEGNLKSAAKGDVFQFMRQGYYAVDKDSEPDKLIFNRTVSLNSSWK